MLSTQLENVLIKANESISDMTEIIVSEWWARKLKKKSWQKNSWNQILVNQKKFFREIAFLAVLNFFPSSKIDFLPFLKLQKVEFGQNKISWYWFIWFHEVFFGLDFFVFKMTHCKLVSQRTHQQQKGGPIIISVVSFFSLYHIQNWFSPFFAKCSL